MKTAFKKLSLVIVTLFAITTVLSGCGNAKDPISATSTEQNSSQTTTQTTDPNKIDTSKEVDLSMYLLGDKPKDFDEVYGLVNEKLKKDINTKLNVNFISWGDMNSKYPLIFASGEDFDMIYTASWSFFNEQASKGGFKELTMDMIQKYAPATFNEVPKVAWEQTKKSGKNFMVPFTKQEYKNLTYVVRGDLREKYNIPEIKTIDDFGLYLDAVAKNEKTIIPYDNGSEFDVYYLPSIGINQLQSWDETLNRSNLAYKFSDASDTKYFDIVETPEFAAFAKKMKEWKGKGYWSKNAFLNKTASKDSFLSGKSASSILNLLNANSLYSEVQKSHPEWKTEVFDTTNGAPVMANSYLNNGMAIHATSKNSERALMLIDLFRNNKEYFDLTTYGIEAKHWQAVGDSKFKVLTASEGYPADGACQWGWRTNLYRSTEGGLPNFDAIYSSRVKQTINHPLETFNYDDSGVKNEIAAINNAKVKYFNSLVLGFGDDSLLKEYISILKTAGIDKVVKDVQKQADEYMKTSK